MIPSKTGKCSDAFICLKKYKNFLTRQEIRTLHGQIKFGNVDGAMNGLSKILERKGV